MKDDKTQGKIQFLAIIAPIMSGIRIAGNGDGMRIQLDIPETEMGAAARLLLMREKVLKITVEVYDMPKYTNNNDVHDFDGYALDSLLRELNNTQPERVQDGA